MIPERELKEILIEFSESEGGLLKEYNALMTVSGDMAHKRRVLEYIVGLDFIELVRYMDSVYYTITKKGLRFIDMLKIDGKEEDDQVESVEGISKRSEEILEKVREAPGITVRELTIDTEHSSTTHNRLNELIELNLIEKRKEGVRNLYYPTESSKSRTDEKEEIPTMPYNSKISLGTTDPKTVTPSDTQLKIIDDLTEFTDEQIQILLKLIQNLPGSWTQFEGKKNHGNNVGYIKIFINDVDDCVDFYNEVKEELPEKPILQIDARKKTNNVKVNLPLADEAG